MSFNVPELASSAIAYDTATEAQAYVDEEIRKLRSLRNTLSPTCRLPPETLATIFVCCALDHHYSHDNNLINYLIPPYVSRDVPSWVNVSYTCRYWRDVALNCPTLWTYHFVVSLRWTGELLARSKQAPLKVCLSIDYTRPDSWWLGPFDELMKHADRFEDLSLRLGSWNAARVLSMLSECSRGPYLQNLNFSTLQFRSEQSFLPFHGDTPALRTLHVANCPVPWWSFNLNALTTLNLFRLPTRFQQNMVEFLATLRCMQDLTEVCLNGAILSASGFLSSSAFRSFQKINLPHLSRLSIEEPLSTVIAFLSCVNIPLKTAVRIACSHEDDSFPGHYTLLRSVLASISKDSALSSPTIRSLVTEFLRKATQVVFSSWDYDGFDSPMAVDSEDSEDSGGDLGWDVGHDSEGVSEDDSEGNSEEVSEEISVGGSVGSSVGSSVDGSEGNSEDATGDDLEDDAKDDLEENSEPASLGNDSEGGDSEGNAEGDTGGDLESDLEDDAGGDMEYDFDDNPEGDMEDDSAGDWDSEG